MTPRERADLAAGIIRAIGAFLAENADAIAQQVTGAAPGPQKAAQTPAEAPVLPGKGAKVLVRYSVPYSPDEREFAGEVVHTEILADGVYDVTVARHDDRGRMERLGYFADQGRWASTTLADAYRIAVTPLE